jgi:hypothetical protein
MFKREANRLKAIVREFLSVFKLPIREIIFLNISVSGNFYIKTKMNFSGMIL